MENAKHIFFSIMFALFALIFIAGAIFGTAIGHHDWKWIYGIIALIYIVCFIFELGKINGWTRIIKHADHVNKEEEDQPAVVKIMHETERELERTEEEIKASIEKTKQLKHKLEELSEEVDVAALEKKDSEESKESK